MSDAISIEATNKIRVSLGLKPLPVPGGGSTAGLNFKDPNESPPAEEDEPGSTLETRQAAGYDNWQKLQDEAEAKAKRAAKNEAIKAARDAARRFAKLEGKGLGDEDDNGEVDTKTWLLQQKKRQKKVEKARKLEQELAEREQQAEYTAADLAGLKVAHGLGAIQEGDDQVLTLKDTTIDENEEEGDELEIVELKETEALSERLELKKKKPVYNPNELDDTADASILGQYDEEIDGKKRQRFTLDGQGNVADGKAHRSQANGKTAPKVFSLDIEEFTAPPASDYLDAKEIKVRKPKKGKKARATRQKAADDDDIFPAVDAGSAQQNDEMVVDSNPLNGTTETAASKKRSYDDASFLDDDDLQASLATQRRSALKKRKKTRPEDIARQFREEASASASATPNAIVPGTTDADDAEAGLVIDETSEFVANLQKPTLPDIRRRRRSTSKPSTTPTPHPDTPHAEDAMDHDMDAPISPPSPETALPSTGLTEEATLTNGLGATVSLLTSRGILNPSTAGSDMDLNALDRQHSSFLLSKSLRLSSAEARARASREHDRASGKLALMSARERELHAQHENKVRDQYESRQLQEVFAKEYKPNVELKYVDEFGRKMGQKEAFKHLSHVFHGKGSGKGKMEKRLKKLEGERREESRGVLDAEGSGGLSGVARGEGRKTGSAGVRLG